MLIHSETIGSYGDAEHSEVTDYECKLINVTLCRVSSSLGRMGVPACIKKPAIIRTTKVLIIKKI